MKSAVIPEEQLPVYVKDGQKFWGSSPVSEKPIFYSKSGSASEKAFQATTVCETLIKAAEKAGDFPALKVERNVGDMTTLKKVNGQFVVPPPKPHSEWATWTYKELLSDTRSLAKAFIKSGTLKNDGVIIFGANSPEWSISCLGAMFAGAKSAGMYPTDTTDLVKFKCDHANGAVLCVDGQKNFDKVKEIVNQLPYLKAIVSWGNLSSTESLKNKLNEDVAVFQWADYLKFGETVSEQELDKRVKEQKPSQSCCYVYTSGTTGSPKAVMLSHDNIVFSAFAITQEGIGNLGQEECQERILSYLPLCHVAGMMIDVICPIVMTAWFPCHFTVFYARTYDLKSGALVERLQDVKPSLFLGVPRVWEKMADKLKQVTSALTGVKGYLARWAMRQGNHQVKQNMMEDGKPLIEHIVSPSMMFKLADKLVLSKVRAKLGLDRVKFCLTGAAPISFDTQDFMANFGITINEAYGLSETSGAMNWNTPTCFRFGSVGPAFACTEVKVFGGDIENINDKKDVPAAKDMFHPTEEEQGELCIRGRQVMIGYMANPRLGKEHVAEINKKNEATIDDEGFLHTADKGCMSENGFFKITGRFKELIIGAGGENIAPVPIEDAIKSICPIISNIVMVGDQRKFNVALVTLKLEGATGEFPGSSDLVVSEFGYLNTASKKIEDAMKDDKVIKEITEKITKTNNNGEVVVINAAKIQKFMILPRDLSITTDDFTATLKLKRGFVTEKFSSVVDLMYASKETCVQFPMDKFSQFYS